MLSFSNIISYVFSFLKRKSYCFLRKLLLNSWRIMCGFVILVKELYPAARAELPAWGPISTLWSDSTITASQQLPLIVQNHFPNAMSVGNDMKQFPFCRALVWTSRVPFLLWFPSYIFTFPLQGFLNGFNLLSQTIFNWHTIALKCQSKLLTLLILTGLPLFWDCDWNSLSGNRQPQWFSIS